MSDDNYRKAAHRIADQIDAKAKMWPFFGDADYDPDDVEIDIIAGKHAGKTLRGKPSVAGYWSVRMPGGGRHLMAVGMVRLVHPGVIRTINIS